MKNNINNPEITLRCKSKCESNFKTITDARRENLLTCDGDPLLILISAINNPLQKDIDFESQSEPYKKFIDTILLLREEELHDVISVLLSLYNLATDDPSVKDLDRNVEWGTEEIERVKKLVIDEINKEIKLLDLSPDDTTPKTNSAPLTSLRLNLGNNVETNRPHSPSPSPDPKESGPLSEKIVRSISATF